MSNIPRSRGWFIAAIAGLLLLVATGASQAVPAGMGTTASEKRAATVSDDEVPVTLGTSLYACVKKKNGRMRMITSGRCEKAEYLVAWNVVGPPGARGGKGPSGSAGPVGPQGPAGPEGPVGPPDGSTVLSGEGEPTAIVGKSGDFYVDMRTWWMWGPKAGNTWSAGTSLIGPPGATGPEGPRGGSGPAGPQGPVGPQGATGQTGPQGPIGPQGPVGAFGAFGDFATQTRAGAAPGTPPAAVLVRQTLVNDGFLWSDDSTYVQLAPNTSPGWFNIQFSMQVQNSAVNDNEAYFWLRWNGVDQSWSNTGVYLGGKSVKVVAAWNFLVPMDADDTISIMWGTDLAGASLLAEATPPVGPAIPSVIYTITQVDDTNYHPL